ncbi:sam-dependent methyltransferase, partial [Cystoisospora suis]
IFSWDAYERFDRPFVAHKLRQAAEIRRKFFAGNAFYRVCNGEADGLPGVILDRYGSNFVLQLHASGLDEFLLPVIQPAIEEVFEEELSRLILRNDSPIRSLEHLPLLTSPRILAGRPGREEVGEEEEGEQPSLQVEMIENGCSFLVDLYKGDTTGWTFYHRNTRDFLASLCKGRSVLEVYSRHGGSFGVQAASRGASCVVSIHPSADIVKLGNLHIDQNCLSSRQILFLQSDISLFLQSFIQRQQEEEESKEHKNEEEEEERKRRERKRGELCGSLPSSSSSCCKAFREIDGAAPKNDGNRSIDMLATDSSSSFASSSLLQRELDTLSTCTFTSSSLPSRHSSLSSSGYHPSRSQKDSNTLSSSLSSSSSAFSASPCSSSSSSPSSPPSSSDHRNPLASFASPEQSCRYLKDGDKKEDKPRQEEQRGCSDVTSEASLRRRDIKISQKDMNSHLSCNSKRSLSSSSRFSLAIFPPGHPKQSTESMLLQAQEAAEKTLDFLQSSSSRFYSSPHPQSLSRPYLHHNRFRRQLQNFDVVILDLPVDIFPSSSLSYFHVKNENLHLLELLFQQALAVTSQDGGLLFFSVTLPGLKRQDFHRLIQKGLKTSPRIEKSHESDREECEEKERRRRIRRCRVLNEGGVQSIDHPTDLGLPFSPSFTHCILLLLDS